MNISRQMLTAIALSTLLLAGCTSQVTQQDQFSGFLPSYDGLQEATTASGAKVMRWQATGFNPSAYDTVVFKGLQQYPAPKPDERVNLQTLQQIQSYANASVKNALSEHFNVVSSVGAAPKGSRVLILNAAMTGVSAANEGMQWYNVIPLSAVVSGVQVATGTRDQDTQLFIEADLVDAASGLPVAKVVRKVFGKQLDNDKEAITADDFKQAINGVASDLKASMK
ncbi:MAG TPA: DUF3313 domain-containing protein [Pseudomonas sp.]|nr:DUF3313 domain-containing protein [Pseudomonas sp.]